MPFKLNPLTSNFDYYDDNFKGVLSTAPPNPQEGWFYINSGDNGLYVYYTSQWQLISTV